MVAAELRSAGRVRDPSLRELVSDSIHKCPQPFANAMDDATFVAPWLRSGGCVRGLLRTIGRLSSRVCSEPSSRPKRILITSSCDVNRMEHVPGAPSELRDEVRGLRCR